MPVVKPIIWGNNNWVELSITFINQRSARVTPFHYKRWKVTDRFQQGAEAVSLENTALPYNVIYRYTVLALTRGAEKKSQKKIFVTKYFIFHTIQT